MMCVDVGVEEWEGGILILITHKLEEYLTDHE